MKTRTPWTPDEEEFPALQELQTAKLSKILLLRVNLEGLPSMKTRTPWTPDEEEFPALQELQTAKLSKILLLRVNLEGLPVPRATLVRAD
ncbi:hypothetical protein HGM15179_016080 [Zosterops borbonicus]|uniref:Uncharacterized protein n=1 Tax=Zosterops borbonicus TaxID=364589 RepID=A0A8K1LEM8_9PASS|nr:hypothetical protein HGM15179_016080 [Zosterops borbonicus]